MLSDTDIIKAKVGAILDETRSDMMSRTAARLPKFEELFDKLLKNTKADPRITAADLKGLYEFAKEAYRKLAAEFGFGGQIGVDHTALRGSVVYVVMLCAGNNPIKTTVHCDERLAYGAVNTYLTGHGIKATAQDIEKWQSEKEAATMLGDKAPADPLAGSGVEGTRVLKCTIQ